MFWVGIAIGGFLASVVWWQIVQEVERYHFRRVRLIRHRSEWAMSAYYRWGSDPGELLGTIDAPEGSNLRR